MEVRKRIRRVGRTRMSFMFKDQRKDLLETVKQVKEVLGVDEAASMYIKYRKHKVKSELFSQFDFDEGPKDDEHSDVSMDFTLSGNDKPVKPLQSFKAFIDLARIMIPIDIYILKSETLPYISQDFIRAIY